MPIDIHDGGTGNRYRFDRESFAEGAELVIHGDDNTIEIGPDVDLRAPKIHIEGNGNTVRLAADLVDVDDVVSSRQGPFILHTSAREAEILVLGDENSIECGRHVELYDSKIQVVGRDNAIRLGHWVRVHVRIDFQTDGALLELGDQTTCVSMHAAVHEPRSLRIGKDCQLAADIYMAVSDTHSIYDLESGKRINHGRDIEVGDHVWLGYRSVVLKGATIGSGSVIGTSAVVGGEIPANCVAVGNPARIVRENVTWDRDLTDTIIDVEAVG